MQHRAVLEPSPFPCLRGEHPGPGLPMPPDLSEFQDLPRPVGRQFLFGNPRTVEAEPDVRIQPVLRDVRTRHQRGQQRLILWRVPVDRDKEFTLVIGVQMGQRLLQPRSQVPPGQNCTPCERRPSGPRGPERPAARPP